MDINVKNDFSKIGFSYLAMGLISIIIQIIVIAIVSKITPTMLTNLNFNTILSAICQYILPIPLFYFMIKKVKKTKIEKHKITIKKFIIFICISITLMYIGNYIGLGITEIISLVKQSSVLNPAVNLIENSNILINLFLISIIAPIFEEFFFRKLLIDRTIQYGAKISIFISAFMFGLFHGNLNQFFYAFLLGGFFAIVYIKTGNIIYPIILHIITNFSGSVVPTTMRNVISTFGNTPEGIIINLIYTVILAILFIIGLIFIYKWKDKIIELKDNIENPLKTSLINIGMICFIIFCVIEIIYVIIK
ncbi:MAG: CPBP family intramembrane metalloprotease [Methanobrevibacter sp.]|nr:CPBP family intramembrane metalloprotease [Methanobrevibacter sp.]